MRFLKNGIAIISGALGALWQIPFALGIMQRIQKGSFWADVHIPDFWLYVYLGCPILNASIILFRIFWFKDIKVWDRMTWICMLLGASAPLLLGTYICISMVLGVAGGV